MVSVAPCSVFSAVELEPDAWDGNEAVVNLLGFADARSSGLFAGLGSDGLDIGGTLLCWRRVDEDENEEPEPTRLCGVCGILREFIRLESGVVSGLPGLTIGVGAIGTGATCCGAGLG